MSKRFYKWMLSIICVVLTLFLVIFLFVNKSSNNGTLIVDQNVLPTIELLEFKGDVTVTDSNGNDTKAFVYREINSGEVITTSDNSSALLLLGDDRYIYLEENSEISINHQFVDDKYVANVKLNKGASLFDINRKLNDDETLFVSTKVSEFTVTGTTFRIYYTEDTDDRPHEVLDVFEGCVSSNIIDSNDTRLVNGNYRVIIREDGLSSVYVSRNQVIENTDKVYIDREIIRYRNNEKLNENDVVMPIDFWALPDDTLLSLIEINNNSNSNNKLIVTNEKLYEYLNGKRTQRVTNKAINNVVTLNQSDESTSSSEGNVPDIKQDLVNKPVAISGLFYNGFDQQLAHEGNDSCIGDMYYSLSTSSTVKPDSGDYVTDITSITKKDAGTYYLWYYASGDASHNPSEPAYIEVKIEKANLLLNGYQTLEYIESTGTQYINTELTINDWKRIVCSFENTSTSDVQYGSIFGAYNSGKYTYPWWTYSGSNSGNAYIPNNFFALTQSKVTISRNKIFTFDVTLNRGGKNSMIISDNKGGNWSYSSSRNNPSNFSGLTDTCKVFRYEASGIYKGRIYKLQLYNTSNELIRDFIPVQQLETGKYGLYDIENKKFYANSGTGDDFIGGQSTSGYPVAVNNLTYDNKEHELIQKTSFNSPITSMAYALTTNATKPDATKFTYDDSSLPKGKDAGTYYVWAMAKNSTNTNYKESAIYEKPIIVTINLPSCVVDAAPGANDLTYNTEDQVLITKGTSTGDHAGDMKYALGTSATTAPSDGDFTYTNDNLPKGKNAGEYYVWYRAVPKDGDTKHVASVPACVDGDSSTTGIQAIKIKKANLLLNGYQTLEYIESTGSQYIDTGVKVNNNSKIDITYGDLDQGSAFGVSNSGYSARFTAGQYLSGSTNVFFSGAGSAFKENKAYYTPTGKHTIILSGTSCVKDGTKLWTYSSGSFSQTNNLFLFAENRWGSAFKHKTKIYKCTIYSGTTIQRNYIPVRNIATGKYGLYDLVNNAFYVNSGTGDDFVAGPSTSGYPTAVENLKYTGDDQELIIANSFKAPITSMAYALTTDATKPEDSAFTYDDSSLPKAKDVGTYYVWAMAKNSSDTNYVESDIYEIPIGPIVIGKGDMTVTTNKATYINTGTLKPTSTSPVTITDPSDSTDTVIKYGLTEGACTSDTLPDITSPQTIYFEITPKAGTDTEKIYSVYKGSLEVNVMTPVTFTNTGSNAADIGFKLNGKTVGSVKLQYSLDGNTWTSFTSSSTEEIVSVPKDGKVMFMAQDGVTNGAFAANASNSNRFTAPTTDSTFDLSGDLISLVSISSPITEPADKQFGWLFYGFDKLVNAKDLVLPQFTSSNGGEYQGLFWNSTKLETAPYIPSSASGSGTYSSMFNSCPDLKSVAVGWTTWPSGSNTMIFKASISGTFYCPEELVDKIPSRGASGVPAGMTIKPLSEYPYQPINAAPKTTLMAPRPRLFVRAEDYLNSISISISVDDLFKDMGSIDYSVSYTEDGILDSSAPIYAIAKPNEGYEFVSWSDGNTDIQREIDKTKPIILKAIFQESVEYYLKDLGFNITLQEDNEDMGIIEYLASYTDEGYINKEEPIYITASANEGYEFVSWSNGQIDAIIELDLTSPIELTATFKEVEEESIDNLEEEGKDDLEETKEEPLESLYLLPSMGKDTKPLYL